jgi:hypothetical protein
MVSVGNGDIAEFASVCLLTIMIFLHVVTVVGILYAFGHVKIVPSKPIVLSFMAGIGILLYLLLMYNGRSSRILLAYKDEDRKAYIRGRIFIICYLLLSVGALMGGMMLMMLRNRGEL